MFSKVDNIGYRFRILKSISRFCRFCNVACSQYIRPRGLCNQVSFYVVGDLIGPMFYPNVEGWGLCFVKPLALYQSNTVESAGRLRTKLAKLLRSLRQASFIATKQHAQGEDFQYPESV